VDAGECRRAGVQACREGAGVQRGCRDRDMQSKTPTLRQLTTRCCRCCSGAARGQRQRGRCRRGTGTGGRRGRWRESGGRSYVEKLMVLLNSGLPCSETPGDRARGALRRQGCQHPTTTCFSFLLFCPSTTARIGGLQSKCCFGRLRGLRGLRAADRRGREGEGQPNWARSYNMLGPPALSISHGRNFALFES
jgi:hypothetical protein